VTRAVLGALAVVAAALAATTLSCIDAAAPPRELDVSIPEGAGLESTCTPTGPEICFNAKDDNCNGVIDEGCGLHTGILQFVIAWEMADVDIDLNVTDPAGDLAKPGEPTPSNLVKDRDCPRAGECQGQNVENVYLSEGEPKKGHYKVEVRWERPVATIGPVRVRLGVRMGPKSFGRTFDLTAGNGTESLEFGFDLR
jgi:hypothetical protein